LFRILILAVALGATSVAFAQAYPAKAVRIVNPFAPGVDIVASTPQELDAFNRAELVKWAKIVKDSGAKLD